jgi:hypothetical protein
MDATQRLDVQFRLWRFALVCKRKLRDGELYRLMLEEMLDLN